MAEIFLGEAEKWSKWMAGIWQGKAGAKNFTVSDSGLWFIRKIQPLYPEKIE
ncbi:hypothetical protein [Planococcus koreensis]|uniref:hypothetical protein n=1 Tax=Planococcus koreensis TaxID=112331 RepID=UPI0039FD2576